MDLNIHIVYKVHHPEPFSMNFHKHSCYELALYTKGEGTVATKDTIYKYRKNTVAIFPPGVLHNETNNYESENLIVAFYSDDNIKTGVFQANDAIVYVLYNLLDEYIGRRKHSDEIARLELEKALYMLSRLDLEKKSENDFSFIISNIDNYIKENMSLPIFICDFAAMYNYSPDRFRHIFTENMNISPKKYVILKRLENSKKLLEETKKSITEISQECGFYDISQFSKMFKKEFSVSPTEYRKNTSISQD